MPCTGKVNVMLFLVATGFKIASIAAVFPKVFTSTRRDSTSNHGKVKEKFRKRMFVQVLDLPIVGSPI
jgi:hypothetical protein